MARDELDMTMRMARMVGAGIADIVEAFNYAKMLTSLRTSERMKAEALYKLTDGGNTAPYIQKFGSENTKFSEMMRDKIDEYNQSADKKDRINYFMSETIDGRKVLWTDEAGSTKISELRKELIIGLGEYYAEVKPSELYQANIGKDVIAIDGVTREELDILKSKPTPGGTDFSLSATPNGDGTYKIEVGKEDFLSGKDREDLFVNLIRANAISASPSRQVLQEELKYDRELKERVIDYDKEEPTYITSATDGGRYIRLTGAGFTIYNVGMNANDIRQIVEKEVMRSECREGDYNKLLYSAVESVNRPVEINRGVCQENEEIFEQVYGKDALIHTTEHRIKGLMMQDLERTRMKFPSVNGKHVPDLMRQLEREENRALSASLAAEMLYRTSKNGEYPAPEKIQEMLNQDAVNAEIRSAFFKEHIVHMEPDLHTEFLEEIRQTDLYKQFQDAAINPDLQDELSRTIENSYQDFFFEVSSDLQAEIKKEYRKFENEIKSNAEAAMKKGLSKYTVQAIDQVQKESGDKSLQIILAKCVTGKSVEGIRPMQMDVPSIKAAEFEDELTQAFVREVEKKLIGKIGKENFSPDILKTELYRVTVKEAVDEILKEVKEGALWKRSKKWRALVKQARDFGGIDDKQLGRLMKSALAIEEYNSDVRGISEQDVTQAAVREKEEPEKWRMLEYEHDEENISRLLKESLKMDDVDLSGNVERMKDAFAERLEEKEREDTEQNENHEDDTDINGDRNYDYDMIPDSEVVEEMERRDDTRHREEEIELDFSED